MEGKALIIINPKSGTRSRTGLEETINNIFGSSAEIVYTQRPLHATELARQAAHSGYTRVVAIGGDGTINETANGLLGTDVPLAIVPFGSGNGLARHLNIPMKRDTALQIAKEGKPITIDCGRMNDKNFFCTMGVGFDAVVSHEFAHTKRRGLLAYSRIAVHNFLHYKPQTYHIEVDGKPNDYTAFIIAVCNAAQYGNNAYIAPHASMTDGLLDVTIVERGHIGSLAKAGVRLFTHHIDRSHIVHCLRGSKICIRRENEGPGHIDGEALTMPAQLNITCCPQVIKVIIP